MANQERDFVSSLANRAPAGIASRIEELRKEESDIAKRLEEAGQRAQEQFQSKQALSQKQLEEAKKFSTATEKEKEIGAAGLSAAVNAIRQEGTLKGKTFADLVKESGADIEDASQKEMSGGEMITRLSMALLPGISAFAVAKASGAANPYIAGAAAQEAGVKGLDYLNQLDKEKRESAEKIRLAKIQAAKEEARDIRRFEREQALAPLKAQETANAIANRIKMEQELLGLKTQADIAKAQAATAGKELYATPEMTDEQKKLIEQQNAIRQQRTELEKQRDIEAGKSGRAAQKMTKELGDPDIGGGFKMNPAKKWTAKDREQAQKIVAGYTGHGQAIDELISTIKEVGRSGAVPFSEARDRLIQASQKYIDSYRGWVGTGANYTAAEMQLAKSVGADLKDGSIDIAKLLWDPKLITSRLEALRSSVRKTAGSKVSTYGAIDTGPIQEAKAPSAAPSAGAGFIKATPELLQKLSPEEKRQYIKADKDTQQTLLKKAAGAK